MKYYICIIIFLLLISCNNTDIQSELNHENIKVEELINYALKQYELKYHQIDDCDKILGDSDRIYIKQNFLKTEHPYTISIAPQENTCGLSLDQEWDMIKKVEAIYNENQSNTFDINVINNGKLEVLNINCIYGKVNISNGGKTYKKVLQLQSDSNNSRTYFTAFIFYEN